jgi:hypothetical protein
MFVKPLMTGFECQADQTSTGRDDFLRTGMRPVLATKSLPGFINTVEFTH